MWIATKGPELHIKLGSKTLVSMQPVGCRMEETCDAPRKMLDKQKDHGVVGLCGEHSKQHG